MNIYGVYPTRRRNAYAKNPTCQRLLSDFKWTVAVSIKARKRVDQQKMIYMLLFSEWKNKGAIIGLMVPEYDKLGRLHYHGTIKIPHTHRMTNYHNSMFSICTKLVRTLEDEEEWNIYCLKEYDTLDSVEDDIQIPRKPMWKDMTRRIHPKNKLERLLDQRWFN